jgi:ankyrin repeat protein
MSRVFAAAVIGLAAAASVHLSADSLLVSASSKGLTLAIPPLVWLGGDKNLALAVAGDYGQSDVARQLIARGADVHANADRPLVSAAISGRTDTARVLLEAGADANAAYGTPLMFAAMNGHTETVRLLVEHGANVHELNDEALRSAECHGHVETAKVLREFGAADPRPLPVPFP